MRISDWSSDVCSSDLNLERHINLGRDDVLIFDLRLGQRGLFDRGPHGGLRAAIELTAFREFQQFARDGRLRVALHGEIGIVPIAPHSKALELFLLPPRSDDRRVGKASVSTCGSRWLPFHY